MMTRATIFTQKGTVHSFLLNNLPLDDQIIWRIGDDYPSEIDDLIERVAVTPELIPLFEENVILILLEEETGNNRINRWIKSFDIQEDND